MFPPKKFILFFLVVLKTMADGQEAYTQNRGTLLLGGGKSQK